MTSAGLSGTKKKIGRPRTDAKSIHLRVVPPALAEIDLWIAAQVDHPSRPEAIRRLVGIALKASAAATDPAEVRQDLEERLR